MQLHNSVGPVEWLKASYYYIFFLFTFVDLSTSIITTLDVELFILPHRDWSGSGSVAAWNFIKWCELGAAAL